MRSEFVVIVSLAFLFLLLPSSLVAAKKVPMISTAATLDSCTVFVQGVLRPARKVQVVSETRIQTYNTMIWTEREEKTLDEELPSETDRFVGITVILSAAPDVRAAGTDGWEARRPGDLAPRAELVFPDGVVSPAIVGAGFDGLESHVDEIVWGPGTIRTDEDGTIVFRNYIWQPKDPFLGTETLYFPVSLEHWKRVKPEKLRIGTVELLFAN